MGEGPVGRGGPEVAFSVEIDPTSNGLLDQDGPLFGAVRESILHGLTEVLDVLGIPGTPNVRVGVPGRNPLRAGEVMRVEVNDRVCRYPAELLQRVHSYVNESPLHPNVTPAFILAW